jgi:lysophospholipase L1-like esterase
MTVIDMTAPPLEPEELADRLRRAPWRRYVAIGDSITEGLGDPVEGYPNLSWVELIIHTFTQLHSDFAFVNLGKRYLTARQVRETQLQPALDFGPDLATVLAGGNDLGDPFDPEGIERELDAIVAALTDAGATVCTLSMPNVVRSGRYPRRMAEVLGPRLAVHREISLRIAERYETVFFDFFSHPRSDDPSIVSDDLLHPNMRGQAIVADATLQGLASLVPEAARGAGARS